MTILNKCTYLILIVLYPLYGQSKNQNYISDSITAVNLNRKAISLYQKGLNTQALDTFYLSLELRKKLYGSNNYNLAPTYLGIGVTYKSLGQLELAIQNYKLAEINYKLAKKDRKSVV